MRKAGLIQGTVVEGSSTHNHNDLYYTETEIGNILAAYETITGAASKYYTKSEVGNLLTGYASVGHSHSFASLTSKPTTLGGYGITDAFTKTESDNRFEPLITKSAGYAKWTGSAWSFLNETYEPANANIQSHISSAHQAIINGTGFVKASGTSLSYENITSSQWITGTYGLRFDSKIGLGADASNQANIYVNGQTTDFGLYVNGAHVTGALLGESSGANAYGIRAIASGAGTTYGGRFEATASGSGIGVLAKGGAIDLLLDNSGIVKMKETYLPSAPATGYGYFYGRGKKAYYMNSDGIAFDLTEVGAPVSGSVNYIQNGTSQQTASFNISGTAKIAGVTNILGGSSLGLTFRSNGIQTEEYDGGDYILMNYKGYQNGTTQFRNFSVFDGKKNKILDLIGSSKQSDFYGNVNIASGSYFQNNGSNIFTAPFTSGTSGPEGYTLVGAGTTTAPTWDNTLFVDRSTVRAAVAGAVNANARLTVVGNQINEGLNGRHQLVINGSTDANKYIGIGYDTQSNYGYINAGIFGTSNSNIILNSSGGNVGIGTNSPSEKLDVNGNVRIRSMVAADGNKTGLVLYDSNGVLQKLAWDGSAKYLRSDGTWQTVSSGSMVYPGAGIAVSLGSAWGSSIVNTIVGTNLLTLTNPGAISFIKINANNTVTARSATDFRTDIGALADPMTTRGDIIIRNASNTTDRLAIGTAGKYLYSNGTDVSWNTPAGLWDSDANGKYTTTKVALNSSGYSGATFYINHTSASIANAMYMDVSGATSGISMNIGTNYGKGLNIAANGVESYGTYSRGTMYGVYGHANGSSGYAYGGYFEANNAAATGYGVYALGSKVGVAGQSAEIGLYGNGTGAASYGIIAASSGTSGTCFGGKFACTATSGTGYGVYSDGKTYDFYAAGIGTDYGTSSSRRWKTNIQPIDNALEMVMKLRGVYFDWNKERGRGPSVGFIAEEMYDVFPRAVQLGEDGLPEAISYGKTTPMLLQAIKELNIKVIEQGKKIKELQNKLKKYEN